ncbi:molybdopterin molybdotransferase MoeA [Cellulomonas fengjieae]|uniref:molybdopterin molybdotransferase MoeA n=1 Tax=Cellulomonas fengjieae TaxID=2819978 RepID=UPI001AAF41F2|nr:gephyrin-like molybdotransferase Glp [Cellulomonas fengjieae]MBO3101068.1 molybdopterin molybdotransferase MoeA [Cellulomonas fengjieae]
MHADVRSLTEHRAAALALAAPLPAVDVLLDDADGLVLAHDLVTDEPLPRWDNSAMDGYAVRQADVTELPATLRVVADLPAGSADEPLVTPGTAARIMTGAPVPTGADTIVPVEATDAGTGTVVVREAPPAGTHLRRAGEDAVPGDVVVTAGTLLGPAAIAAVASLGRPVVRAHRRPRVAVVSTGDELVAPGTPLRRGQIPDSNSWLLAAAVREAGGIPVRFGPVPDDVAVLRELLAGLDVDAIVTSGGVSVGAYDVVKAALADEPDVEFVSVAVQPGKPQGLGRLPGGTPIWTLPGNPVSSFASFEMFVRPAILRMRGLRDVERPTRQAVTDEGWTTPPGRAQLMPVRWVGPDRVVRATARGSGSHLVARLALAEGLAVIPAEIDRVAAGDRVTVLKVSP